MERVELEVTNPHGLHARPGALFVQTAARFKSSVTLRNLARPERSVNAKSIMEVLTAGVNQGSRIELAAEGDDEREAIAALADLIRTGLS